MLTPKLSWEPSPNVSDERLYSYYAAMFICMILSELK